MLKPKDFHAVRPNTFPSLPKTPTVSRFSLRGGGALRPFGGCGCRHHLLTRGPKIKRMAPVITGLKHQHRPGDTEFFGLAAAGEMGKVGIVCWAKRKQHAKRMWFSEVRQATPKPKRTKVAEDHVKYCKITASKECIALPRDSNKKGGVIFNQSPLLKGQESYGHYIRSTWNSSGFGHLLKNLCFYQTGGSNLASKTAEKSGAVHSRGLHAVRCAGHHFTRLRVGLWRAAAAEAHAARHGASALAASNADVQVTPCRVGWLDTKFISLSKQKSKQTKMEWCYTWTNGFTRYVFLIQKKRHKPMVSTGCISSFAWRSLLVAKLPMDGTELWVATVHLESNSQDLRREQLRHWVGGWKSLWW